MRAGYLNIQTMKGVTKIKFQVPVIVFPYLLQLHLQPAQQERFVYTASFGVTLTEINKLLLIPMMAILQVVETYFQQKRICILLITTVLTCLPSGLTYFVALHLGIHW